jgi:hypothetical protein
MDATLQATTRQARITGPVPYRSGSGRQMNIPIGPCLLEGLDSPRVDIIWGTRGQSSVALTIAEVLAAREHGHLVMLD